MKWLQDWKTILKLTIPNVAAFSSNTIMNTINLIMIGSLGPASIAAVGVVNVLMYNLFALFRGFGASVNFVVAQSYGAGTLEKGIQRTYQALYVAVAIALMMIPLAFLLPVPALHWMGASRAVVEAGVGYLALRLISFSFIMFTNVLNGFINGIGDTKRTMYIGIAQNTTNIILNYGFIHGTFGLPRLGVTGLGWAFVIANAGGLLFTSYYFFINLNKTYHTRQKVRILWQDIKLMTRESGKIGFQELGMSGSMLIFTIFVTALGTKPLAANEIALTILALAFLPGMGFGATATILVGQEIGRRASARAKHVGQEVAALGFLFMGICGILFFVFANQIAGLYTNDPQVKEMAATLIRIASFFQLFDSGQMVYTGGLRGAGDTTFLLWWSLILGWLFFIPLTYILTDLLHFGLVGAWVAQYVYIFALFAVTGWRYYTLRWHEVQPI
jgi:multidrug resistance protein, MATE family